MDGNQKNSLNKNEVEFCEAAAWLGLDAYEIDESTANKLIALWNRTPVSLRVDFFQASNFTELSNVIQWINIGLEKIDGLPQRDLKWKGLLSNSVTHSSVKTPWENGYALARQARKHFKLKNHFPVRIEDLGKTRIQFIDADVPPLLSIEALFSVKGKGDRSYCYTSKKRSDSRQFLAARGLFHLLFGSPAHVSLLSKANTESQQREGAFAAEFLAPADYIQAADYR